MSKKDNKRTCIICSHQWEQAETASGFFECPECGYLNEEPWMSEGGWQDD